MIVTSNSVTHNFTIPSLLTVGQVDSNYDVIEQVTVYINSSTTFDHTFDTTDIDGNTTSVTESKTVDESSYYTVNLNTSNIPSFQAYNDLEEDTVLQWAFDVDPDRKTSLQNTNETNVLEAKDKVLNPLKYKKDTPSTPWARRAREALDGE